MQVTRLAPHLGARIDGIDLARLDDTGFAALEAAFHKHGVIAISGQRLDEGALIAFSRRWGTLEINVASSFRHRRYPEINVLSNKKGADGKDIGARDAGQGWHTDMSYNPVPARASILHALDVPMRDGEAKGDTLFASMAAAYAALDPAMKARIENLAAVHHFSKFYDYMIEEKGSTRPPLTAEQRATKPPVTHPMVVRHPFTGAKCLYCDPGYTVRILGLDPQESDALLRELFAHQTRAQFQYRHKWRVGDVLMWDNVATIHMATGDYRDDEPRLMLRCQVLGDAARHHAANPAMASA